MIGDPGQGRVVERTPNHAIGVYDDMVILYAFPGSSEDARHLLVTSEVVKAEANRLKRPVRLLAVLTHSGLTSPPSVAVRATVQERAHRDVDHVSKVSIVVAGEGFGAAIHRAVVSGILGVFGGAVRPFVCADVRHALAYLLAPEQVNDGVLQFCERELSSPDPG
jgi:hypothetical protein